MVIDQIRLDLESLSEICSAISCWCSSKSYAGG